MDADGDRMHQNLMISANTLMREVALAVLQDDGGALEKISRNFASVEICFCKHSDHGLDPGYDQAEHFTCFSDESMPSRDGNRFWKKLELL